MASDRQVRANRHNARKSTGPKSREGKSAVSLNARKHGLLSRHGTQFDFMISFQGHDLSQKEREAFRDLFQ